MLHGKHVNKPWQRTQGEASLRGGAAWGGAKGTGVLRELLWGASSLGKPLRDQGPSVDLEESKVGQERGSLEMGPGEGSDP